MVGHVVQKKTNRLIEGYSNAGVDFQAAFLIEISITNYKNFGVKHFHASLYEEIY